jgi:hypothetical protein
VQDRRCSAASLGEGEDAGGEVGYEDSALRAGAFADLDFNRSGDLANDFEGDLDADLTCRRIEQGSGDRVDANTRAAERGDEAPVRIEAGKEDLGAVVEIGSKNSGAWSSALA